MPLSIWPFLLSPSGNVKAIPGLKISGGSMRMMVMTLLLLQIIITLEGCHTIGRSWELLKSARETPLELDRQWDIHEKDRRLLLVMVHGFDSSSDKAWGQFPEIIKSQKDTEFAGFNVVRYGYGSKACRNSVDLYERGDGLKSFLSEELRVHNGMIIMGHSMGGLVGMRALVGLAKDHNLDLQRVPIRVMTFGAPHQGVEGAELLGQISFVCADKQAEALTLFNPSLGDLRTDWDSLFGHASTRYNVPINTYYGADDKVAPKANACGLFPGCEAVDGENHAMIVKPSDTNHLAYKKLRHQMDNIRGTLAQQAHPYETLPLVITCGDLSLLGLTTKPSTFVQEWIPYLIELRTTKIVHDFETLMSIRPHLRKYGSAHHEEVRQANFTLNCLEKNGYLSTETLDTPNMVGGEFKNRKITFLKPIPRITIPE